MSMALLPDGAFLSATSHGEVLLYSPDGVLKRIFDAPGMWGAVAVLPDGVHFVVSTESDVKLFHVDGTLVQTFEGACSMSARSGGDNSVNAVAVTSDGLHLITGGDDEYVKVWEIASKKLVGETHCMGLVWAVAVMPDGKRILSGDGMGTFGPRDGYVAVSQLDGIIKKIFKLHEGDVKSLVAMPDNQHALSGSEDTTIKLFDVDDGTVLRTFTHHIDSVYSLALLPDGLRFVSGSGDKTACVVYHGLAP